MSINTPLHFIDEEREEPRGVIYLLSGSIDPESKWLNCGWTPKSTLPTTVWRAVLPCEVRHGWKGLVVSEVPLKR